MQVEHFRNDDINADWDFVSHIVKSVPNHAAFGSYAFTFDQVPYHASCNVENVDVHRAADFIEMVADEAIIVETVAVG